MNDDNKVAAVVGEKDVCLTVIDPMTAYSLIGLEYRTGDARCLMQIV
jgi:hypothetical protein